jgi:hypothetical protein
MKLVGEPAPLAVLTLRGCVGPERRGLVVKWLKQQGRALERRRGELSPRYVARLILTPKQEG